MQTELDDFASDPSIVRVAVYRARHRVDLFLRKLPTQAGDELTEVLMSRYEHASTIVTSNRPLDDWARLLGDTVVVTPLLDRLMHHGHLLKFEGKSWRLKEAAARVATRPSTP